MANKDRILEYLETQERSDHFKMRKVRSRKKMDEVRIKVGGFEVQADE
jgi:hypothetical protein